MSRRWFVTGATGFIGSRLTERLLQDGAEVVALVRDPATANDLEAMGAELVRGDVTDKDGLVVPMRDVDGVFHLAGWYKVGAKDAHMAERVNVRGTQNVLDAMREAGVEKGVYTSTCAVFGDTNGRLAREGDPYGGPKGAPWSSMERGRFLSEYDRTKWAAHHEVAKPMMAAGLPLVIVQPGAVYGPGDHSPVGVLLRRYLRSQLPLVPERTAVCWGHVDDTVEAHVLAMDLGVPGEEYIVAGPPHTLVEALGIAERETGIPAPSRRASPRLLRGLSNVSSAIEAFGMALPQTYAAETLRVSAGVTYLADNAKAREELGFAPRPLEEGLGPVLDAELAAMRVGDPSGVR